MKLSVLHRTTYTYDQPQRHVLQSHRLWPSAFDGQNVIEWEVGTDGGVEGSTFRDGAGDQVATVRVAGPVDRVVVEVRGVIETRDTSGVLQNHRERVPPMAYLRSSRMTQPDLALQDLGVRTLEGMDGASVLDQAHALSRAVTDAVAYTPGTTEASTTAADALAGGAGVCQDQTHVLIALALSQNIPARYVAGYLFAESGEATDADRPDSSASHAWAELHVGNLGWVGFDPANRCCPDDRYIRLCSGYDAFDAAPIRGISAGKGTEALDVDLTVQTAQQ